MSEQIRLFEPDLSSWVEAVWKQAGPEPRREIIAILAEIGRCALEEQHELLRDEDRGVLIDFWSPWCTPCRALRPHLNKMAAEYDRRWRFVAINVDRHPSVAQEFQVSALPTWSGFEMGTSWVDSPVELRCPLWSRS